MLELLVVGWMLLMVPGAVALDTNITLNEDDILGTCVHECDEIPELLNNNNCDVLSQCSLSAEGYMEGLVRCDYCACTCTTNDNHTDSYDQITARTIAEPELDGTCNGVCSARIGVVKTDYRGCSQIRDCWKERKGWKSNSVRCDYCGCTCDKLFLAASYVLAEVKYDFGALLAMENDVSGISVTTLENNGDDPLNISIPLTIPQTSTTTVTTSHRLQAGLVVTVHGIAGVPTDTVNENVEETLIAGFTFSALTSQTDTTPVTITAEVEVPAHSYIEATITGHQCDIALPFTATLETSYMYEDEDLTRMKSVTGVYNNIHIVRFHVSYSSPQLIT